MNIKQTEQTRHIYTVDGLTRSIKSILEENLGDIWVKGEISNCRKAASGHMYLTLKDDKSVIRAVLFRGYQSGIKFEIEDGLTVIVHGNISVFEKRGEYQIIIDFLEPEGVGALQLAFEQLKKKLAEEGLFDETLKTPIPPFPGTVGVVTSPNGAAIRDILNVIGRRYSGMHIIVYPTLVQGGEAAQSIAGAIERANERDEVEVLIVGRGGGSAEDLWPFNEEVVARAIHNSHIPIISAVGHEIDFTISDFVADLRAPTPSAAAELVVRNKTELIRQLRDLAARLVQSVQSMVHLQVEILSRYSHDALRTKIENILREKQLVLDDLEKMLAIRISDVHKKTRSSLEKLVGELDVLSPLNTLSRGYAIISRSRDRKPVFSILKVHPDEEIQSMLKDGIIFSTVQKTEKLPHT
jgi:exodeoxyribonuclease VII large subunit